VPLRIKTHSGTQTRIVELAAGTRTAAIPLDERPHRIVLDPDNRVLRRLAHDEAPPILREVQLSGETALTVLGDRRIESAAHTLAARLLDHRPAQHSRDAPPGTRPLLVIGGGHEILRWLDRHTLPAIPQEVSGRGDARMWTFRLADGTPVAVVAADSAAALERTIRPLPHYGRHSWLVVDRGRVVERGVWPARAPSITVAEPTGPAGQSHEGPSRFAADAAPTRMAWLCQAAVGAASAAKEVHAIALTCTIGDAGAQAGPR